MYESPPSPPPYKVALAMMLAHTNPVVFKTTLKKWGRGGGGGQILMHVVWEVLLKTIGKYWHVFILSQVVLSEVVACYTYFLSGALILCLFSFFVGVGGGENQGIGKEKSFIPLEGQAW